MVYEIRKFVRSFVKLVSHFIFLSTSDVQIYFAIGNVSDHFIWEKEKINYNLWIHSEKNVKA